MKMNFVRKMPTFNFLSVIMNGLFFIDIYNLMAMGDR